MRYRYWAISADGKRLQGECHADTLSALEADLARQAMTLLRARAARVPRRQDPGWRARADFCFHLAQLQGAGIPLLETLALLANAMPSGPLTQVLPDVLNRIRNGATFSAALSVYPQCFGIALVYGVKAGESSGRLVEALDDLKESFLWREEMASRTRKALYYPAFAAVIMLAATVFLLISVMPQVRDFVADAGGTLPWSTQLLLLVSEGMVQFGHWLLIGLAGLAALLLVLVRRSTSAALYADRAVLRLPVIGPLLYQSALAQYARQLALLYDAGVPLLDALDIAVATLTRPALATTLAQVKPRVEAGATLSQAFASIGVVPPLLMAMLQTGEATGQLGAGLRQAAHYYRRLVEDRAQRLQSLVEPVLTLVLGGLLAWIMLAVLGPVFDNLARMR